MSILNEIGAIALSVSQSFSGFVADNDDTIAKLAVGSGTTAATASTIVVATAPTAVAHSSGMLILSSGGYLAGTIGTFATAVAAAPVVAAVGTATALAGGGYLVYQYVNDDNENTIEKSAVDSGSTAVDHASGEILLATSSGYLEGTIDADTE